MANHSSTHLFYFDERGFVMQYPREWVRQNIQNSLIFLSPRENKEDDFRENVNLQIQTLPGKENTLSDFTKITKKLMQETIKLAQNVVFHDIVINGREAIELSFQVPTPKRLLTIRQYWFVENNRAFLFTYTADANQFEKYQAVADQIVQSFRFGSIELPPSSKE